ncbi:MAG: hypothetical protein LLG00_15185 [Planctomycetaceae bacterium]|nr:hypothetical protein [Planctomycetaceae bacterium]
MGEPKMAGRGRDALEIRGPAHSGDTPEPQADQFDWLPSVSIKATGGSKHKQPSTRSTIRVVGTIISGVLGLGVGYLALYLLCPQHPFVNQTTNTTNSSDESPKRTASITPVIASAGTMSKTRRPESPLSPSVRPRLQEPEDDRSSPSGPPRDPEPAAIPSLSSPPADENSRQPPPDPAPAPNTPKAVPPQEDGAKLVLDLSRSVSRTRLAEAVADNEVHVKVVDVTGLGTPWEARPAHGTISKGQPVDVVLKEYTGVTIHLSLSSRNGILVEAAPQAELGQGRRIALTSRWVKQSLASANKNLDRASQQLSRAKTAAQSIEIWLKSPGLKPLQLRGEKKHELNVLKDQAIPALERQVTFAQAGVDTLQRLSRLADQIHGTASIHLVIRKEIKDAAKEVAQPGVGLELRERKGDTSRY